MNSDRPGGVTMPGKEAAMIELRDHQLQALDTETQPIAVVDPRTGQKYRLIREEISELCAAR